MIENPPLLPLSLKDKLVSQGISFSHVTATGEAPEVINENVKNLFH